MKQSAQDDTNQTMPWTESATGFDRKAMMFFKKAKINQLIQLFLDKEFTADLVACALIELLKHGETAKAKAVVANAEVDKKWRSVEEGEEFEFDLMNFLYLESELA